jgi:DNA-binding PadR family transcriptional regulator
MSNAELEAIDLALAGRPVPEEHAALGALAVALREDRPRLAPERARALDARLTGKLRPAPRRRPGLGLLAVPALAALLLALVVVLPRGGASDEQAGGGGVSGGGAGSTAQSPQAPSPDARRNRFVVRSAFLRLATAPGGVERAADAASRAADDAGGYTLRATVSRGMGAELVLRVPSARLAPTLTALSRLGSVRERSQSSTDVTAAFASARERLADARAERDGARRALARTGSEAARARLRRAARRLETAERAAGRTRNRARSATVTVSIAAERDAGAPGGRWTPGDAGRDALRVLEVMAGVALVALAVLAPLALLALLALLARGAARWRRERALQLLSR